MEASLRNLPPRVLKNLINDIAAGLPNTPWPETSARGTAYYPRMRPVPALELNWRSLRTSAVNRERRGEREGERERERAAEALSGAAGERGWNRKGPDIRIIQGELTQGGFRLLSRHYRSLSRPPPYPAHRPVHRALIVLIDPRSIRRVRRSAPRA